MQYLAVLGRQPELSLIELESVLGFGNLEAFGSNTAILNQLPKIDHLGGTLKLGRVIGHQTAHSLKQVTIDPHLLPIAEGKNVFAISLYGSDEPFGKVQRFGLELKKRLAERGSMRLILPQAPDLAISAAQLRHHRILNKGFDLMIAFDRGRVVLALTEAYQDIDWYSRRDYGRPVRSAKVGMLPPKLAQILINTAEQSAICDPFCGVGTVLMEALLMGRAAYGSDVDPKMIRATEQNLDWLKAEVKAALPNWQTTVGDATSLSLPKDVSIVSEGSLGPPHPSVKQLPSILSSSSQLYYSALTNWARQLPPGTSLSLCLPVWQINGRWQRMSLIDQIPDMGYTLRRFATADSRNLIYWRAGQSVGRQLLLIRKE